jgi:hypothetical protein
MYERVGVAMDQMPVGAIAAMDLGDAQRPVLVMQAPDLPVLPLDHRKDDGVTPACACTSSSFASPALK